MKDKNIKDEKWYKELKIKGLTDYEGNYVEMISVGKDKQEYLHWSDGAITVRGFKRDRLFNTIYKLIKFWKLNKILIKITIITLLIMLVGYGIKYLVSLF